MREFRRFDLSVTLGLVLASAAFSACAGGGDQNSPVAIQQPANPAVPTSTAGPIPLSHTGFAMPLQGAQGISGTITLTPNNAPPGATLSVVANPTSEGGPPVPAISPMTFAYISLTASSDVTLSAFPKLSVTLPSPVANRGQLHAWLSGPNSSWNDLGTITADGPTLAFGGSGAPITLKGGVTYVAVPFTTAGGATCPTPTPTPTPHPGVKLYVSNEGRGTVSVFDENGNSISTSGGFPGLTAPQFMGPDPLVGRLYVYNGDPNLKVFDENGNLVHTSGPFANAGGGVVTAIASLNRVYEPAAFQNTMTVWDLNGHRLEIGGFLNLNQPLGMVFVPLDSRLYVVNNVGTIAAYDANGNQITTTGTFPTLVRPTAIAFDPLNDRLYVTDCQTSNDLPGCGSAPGTVRVYDLDGNLIPAVSSNSFPGLPAGNNQAAGITFDRLNRWLYVVNKQGTINVFTESGQPVNTGGFSGLVQPVDIKIALPCGCP